MIGCFDSLDAAQITLAWNGPNLVLAVLFPPFNLVVTASTNVSVGAIQNSVRHFGLDIVDERKAVLMSRHLALFLFGARSTLFRSLLRHDSIRVLRSTKGKVR